MPLAHEPTSSNQTLQFADPASAARARVAPDHNPPPIAAQVVEGDEKEVRLTRASQLNPAFARGTSGLAAGLGCDADNGAMRNLCETCLTSRFSCDSHPLYG